MPILFLYHSFYPFQKIRYVLYFNSWSALINCRIKYSWFQDYFLSCIDPLLKLSQLNYEKCPAAKLLENSRKEKKKLERLVKKAFSRENKGIS